MAFVEDMFKGSNIVTGLAIGLGGMILAPVIVPLLGGIARPIAKLAIQGGLSLYEKGRGMVAETGEAISDLVAEARSELRQGAAEQEHFGPP